ncbi:NCS2 family permease [Fructilactobacillus fructivorans]|uniref:Xanthine/uracil/thiamine/ascorbate permease family protein n=1 Tax=Fructilactobacillus fructivorans TaxID=1614 RepID=A0A0C1Q3Q3_9LACO|nr:NCS2 family permease [Fructilactobacillus fructivorans]KID42513.1 Xanthine/uracil/thiamine/ascorbate permease family protein [Fructilactobacillus fructivorans]MCT0151573.1 NCS2 family permease [Fructilactobacillus fructivorans]MCT2868117.1 NCS2 family permease [Fructilactobacillus fructivorans]MCT2868614.1 NCS2 family permease [Fructilactobacillus fructivorans]MCT2873760.1 NCS2 family permease [Fructilactobacillus fructivorans]
MANRIASFFHFQELGTNFTRETIAGVTTFVSMVYILFVNPNVLGAAGMDKGAVFTATALASAFGCFLMGIIANYPFALSASLGLNAFFAYSVCIGMHIPWQTALAGVFVASILFVILTLLKLREKIIDSIPSDLKSAIAGGIGLFIAFLGLNNGGLVVANKSTLVGLGSFSNPLTLLTVAGLVITLFLMAANVPASIFIGMVASAVIGVLFGLIKMPTGIVSGVPSIKSTFLVGLFNVDKINTPQLIVVVLTFLLVTFFDTAGTLVGLAEQAGYMKDNKIPRIGRALGADSVTMLVGSLLGTSPMGAYVESSAGIAVGGRSGFTVIITGILFLLAMFFSPLLTVITSQVTAPALIIVGILMAKSLGNIHWNKFEIAAPAFLIAIGMPLTYSISDGIALGFIAYPITMIAAKRGREVGWMMYALAIIFLVFLWILNIK